MVAVVVTSSQQKIVVNPPRSTVSVINTGPMGPRGVPGAAGSDGLDGVPVGTVLDYIGLVAPTNYLMLDGSTVTNAQTLYSDLWAVAPVGWRSGSDLILPDARGRATIGAGTGAGLTARALGSTGGSETHTLTAAQSGLPAHNHTQNAHTHIQDAHTHTQNAHTHVQDAHAHTQAAHNHAISDSGGFNIGVANENNPAGGVGHYVRGTNVIVVSNATPTINNTTATNQNTTATNQNATATNQNATATNNANSAADAAASHPIMQPWLALNKIIRV